MNKLAFLFLSILFQSGVHDCAVVKRDNEGAISSGGPTLKSFFGESEEKNLEREILEELNHLSSRKQREIFSDLEKQQEKFNASSKSLVLIEQENLSPLNVEELKTIRKTIKSSNNTIPAIRNKRTLNFLLHAVARAMGYTLTPTNPDAEWLPRQQPPSSQPAPQPCSTPAPPCRPSPPSTPPPCAPPTAPPCTGAMMQSPTIPPNQIDANTISYPYRPARTIPLLNFAPLPAGIRVPYPPLLQPPNQQRSSCPPQQPAPQPCATPRPSPPPCMTTPAPKPPPCRPMTTPPPCSTPPPPCGTTPPPMPPPCATTPAPPPPCNPTPAPCTTTPMPLPCATPPPSPPPCGNPPAEQPPKKGSIVLEYDDPVRIQIFSNGKKYLPASDNIFSGWNDDTKEDAHSYPISDNESAGKKGEDYEEKEETEEEHIEEEEEDTPEHYEEEKDGATANDDENESETSLSVVKKPAEQDSQRRSVSKTNTPVAKDSKSGKKEGYSDTETSEKSLKMKKPKKKKWVRIVKKQRRKTKTDSSPNSSFPDYTIDSFPESSRLFPKLYKDSNHGFDSFEKDVSDYSGDSSSHSSEDVAQIDLKKVRVNGKELNLADAVDNRRYEFNINPYVLEPESERRKKLEKAVERYVENYVEKQLGQELIKNTGIPKTTVFEFAPKNGPKIQTITTTVAKTSSSVKPGNFKPQNNAETFYPYTAPRRNPHPARNGYRDVFNRRGDASYEAFTSRE